MNPWLVCFSFSLSYLEVEHRCVRQSEAPTMLLKNNPFPTDITARLIATTFAGYT